MLFVVFLILHLRILTVWHQRNHLLSQCTVIEPQNLRGETILLGLIAAVLLREIQDVWVGTLIQEVVYRFIELLLHTQMQRRLPKLVHHVDFSTTVNQPGRHLIIALEYMMHQNGRAIFIFDIQVLGPHREKVDNLMEILLCCEHDWVQTLRVVAILSQIALVIHQLQQLDVLFGDADENRREVFLSVRSIIIQLDLLHHKQACAFRSVVQDGIGEGTHFRLFIEFVHQPFLLFLATLFCVHDHDIEYLIVAIVSSNLKGRHAIVSLYIHRIV